MYAFRRREARETAVCTEEELAIEKIVSNAAKEEHIVDKLYQLIPDKSKDQIQAKTAIIRKQLYDKVYSHFNQEDMQFLVFLVDGQMPNILPEYSAIPATGKAKYANDHYKDIDWKLTGMCLGKQATKCREIYGNMPQPMAQPREWNVGKTERLYKAVGLFKGRKVNWATVSEMVGSRSKPQCYRNYY